MSIVVTSDAKANGTDPLSPGQVASLQAAGSGHALQAMGKDGNLDELERIRRAVIAVGDCAYHWDIASDALSWSEGSAQFLGGADKNLMQTGRGFASLIDPDNFTSRFETVMRSAVLDDGDGVPFSIEYQFRPRGRDGTQAVWVEDCGRWFAGSDGKPAEVLGMVRRIDDRYARDQHLRFLGNCDPLTGMMNRGRMAEALGETISQAQDNDTPCAFLIAAISNLAVVNDAYGFDVADDVIISVGRRLRQVVRTGDAIGRYSGSKFGLILSKCTEEELQIAAERFLAVARDSVIETDRGPVWAMLSIGGLILPKYAGGPNAAMARAEEALAEARRLPGDGFIGYKPSQERISVRSLNARCASEIVTALRHDRLTLAFQPVVDAQTGKIAMHEALLRMNCDDGDSVAAAHLIPVAEKLGLVRLIDRTVIKLAIETLTEYPDVKLCLNVSGITATDPRWFCQLTEMLNEVPEVASRIVVEITETIALNDLEETTRFIASLRELGCSVAIDDFGAGYTSFRNLKVLNVDMVKIDGSFCERLSENRDNQYFVRSLIDLAKKFNLKIVAEWVQDMADAELLRSWGVDYMQGNLFGEACLDRPWDESMTTAAPRFEKQGEFVFDPSVAVSQAQALTEKEVSDEGDVILNALPAAEGAPFEVKRLAEAPNTGDRPVPEPVQTVDMPAPADMSGDHGEGDAGEPEPGEVEPFVPRPEPEVEGHEEVPFRFLPEDLLSAEPDDETLSADAADSGGDSGAAVDGGESPGELAPNEAAASVIAEETEPPCDDTGQHDGEGVDRDLEATEPQCDPQDDGRSADSANASADSANAIDQSRPAEPETSKLKAALALLDQTFSSADNSSSANDRTDDTAG